MKKLSFYIFLLLLCFNFLNKANAIPKKGNGQGDLALSEDIIKEFHSYIITRVNNNPVNFFITADHKNVFIEIRKNTTYRGVSGSGPITRNKKKCEQKYKQECFLFANQRVVVWNNSINPIDSKKSKIKSKTSYDELIIKLDELGFIETKEQKVAKKVTSKKTAKNVTWEVFVKLTGELGGNNAVLPGFNAKQTSKLKTVTEQKYILKKTMDEAIYQCKYSNVVWVVAYRGKKICTVTVVKYFDEENPNNNNKYVNLLGIKFDDLIITINGLENVTSEKIEDKAAKEKKLTANKTITNDEILAKCIYVGHSMMRTTYKLIEFKINTNSKKLFHSTIWVNDGLQKEYNRYLDIINWSGTKITYAYPDWGTGFTIDYGSKIFFEVYPKPVNGISNRSKCTIVNDTEQKVLEEKIDQTEIVKTDKKIAEEKLNKKLSLIPAETDLEKAQNFINIIKNFVKQNSDEFDILKLSEFFIAIKPISNGSLDSKLKNDLELLKEFTNSSSAFVKHYNNIKKEKRDNKLNKINDAISSLENNIKIIKGFLLEDTNSIYLEEWLNTIKNVESIINDPSSYDQLILANDDLIKLRNSKNEIDRVTNDLNNNIDELKEILKQNLTTDLAPLIIKQSKILELAIENQILSDMKLANQKFVEFIFKTIEEPKIEIERKKQTEEKKRIQEEVQKRGEEKKLRDKQLAEEKKLRDKQLAKEKMSNEIKKWWKSF